jgi:hypothetical protein
MFLEKESHAVLTMACGAGTGKVFLADAAMKPRQACGRHDRPA